MVVVITWYLNGFPTGSNLGSTVYNVGEKPTAILYTYINPHAQPPIIPQHNHSNKQPIMRIEDRLFDRGWVKVRNGDQKVRKYVFPEKNYGRQEVHKYFCTSVNGGFT